MGVETEIISQHNLNTNNVYELACDLSKRLKINVQYGYQDTFRFDHTTGEDLSTAYICILDEVKHPTSNEVYQLLDHTYQMKEYGRIYGEEFIKDKKIKISRFLKRRYKEAINNIYFELTCQTEDIGRWDGFIIRDCFHWDFYSTKWGLFCRYFEQWGNDNLTFKYLNQKRRRIKRLVRKLGGKDVLYIPDAGDITEDLAVENHCWDYIIKEVNRHYPNSIIYVPDFVRNKKVLARNDSPDAFYDDFSDL